MSNFEALPTQPDWREQYSPYPLPGENGILQQPKYEQPASSDVTDNNQSRQQSGAVPHLEHQHSLYSVQQNTQPPPLAAQLDAAPTGDQLNVATSDDSLASTKPRSHSVATLASNPLDAVSTSTPQQGPLANDEGAECPSELKEEDDELEDDEMLDAEDATAPPRTAAERRAERRKMKRFRYDHDTTLVYVPSS